MSTFIADQSTKEEASTLIRPVEQTKPIHSAFFDLKTKQLILNDDGMMSGDAKPPSRLNQNSTQKTPEEMLREFNEKLQLNAARRERFLENIVLKSRRIVSIPFHSTTNLNSSTTQSLVSTSLTFRQKFY